MTETTTRTTTLILAVAAAIFLLILLSNCSKNNSMNISKDDENEGFFVLSSSAAAASSSSVPLPKPYPSAFQISFVTNITRKDDDDKQQQQQQKQQYPIPGQLYYDSSIPAQRVDHDSGSFECLHFYQHNQPCSLYFLGKEGMYRILHYNNNNNNNNTKTTNLNISSGSNSKTSGDKDEIDCCLDLKGIGPPPRDWARRGNPTYAGTVIDEFSGVPAQEWVFHPSSDNNNNNNNNNNASLENNTMDESSSWWWYDYFNYRKQNINKYHHQQQSMIRRQTKEGGQRTAVVASTSSSSSSPADTYHTSRQALFPPNEGTPLLFTFPGSAHGTQDYHYLMETMITQDKIEPIKFHIPSSCRNRLCDSNSNNDYRNQ